MKQILIAREVLKARRRSVNYFIAPALADFSCCHWKTKNVTQAVFKLQLKLQGKGEKQILIEARARENIGEWKPEIIRQLVSTNCFPDPERNISTS